MGRTQIITLSSRKVKLPDAIKFQKGTVAVGRCALLRYPPPCLRHFVAYGAPLPSVSPEYSSETSLSIAVRYSDGVSPRETELRSNSLSQGHRNPENQKMQ